MTRQLLFANILIMNFMTSNNLRKFGVFHAVCSSSSSSSSNSRSNIYIWHTDMPHSHKEMCLLPFLNCPTDMGDCSNDKITNSPVFVHSVHYNLATSLVSTRQRYRFNVHSSKQLTKSICINAVLK